MLTSGRKHKNYIVHTTVFQHADSDFKCTALSEYGFPIKMKIFLNSSKIYQFVFLYNKFWLHVDFLMYLNGALSQDLAI